MVHETLDGWRIEMIPQSAYERSRYDFVVSHKGHGVHRVMMKTTVKEIISKIAGGVLLEKDKKEHDA